MLAPGIEEKMKPVKYGVYRLPIIRDLCDGHRMVRIDPKNSHLLASVSDEYLVEVYETPPPPAETAGPDDPKDYRGKMGCFT